MHCAWIHAGYKRALWKKLYPLRAVKGLIVLDFAKGYDYEIWKSSCNTDLRLPNSNAEQKEP
jgi:hypothetical protein